MTHEYFLYAIVAASCIGIYYARAAVSIATATLGTIALVTLMMPGKLKSLMRSKETLALTAVFGVYLLSGLNSANTEMWLSRVGDNLPFLAIPAGIWAFMPLSARQVRVAVGIFLAATAFSSLLVMGSYVIHFDEYNDLYRVGKTIPTPIIHVRYAYFLALGAIGGAGLLLNGTIESRKWRWFVFVLTLWLTICVHILAVRTGIFALYGGLLSLAVVYAVFSKQWKHVAIVLVVIIGMIVGSVALLPSVGNKLQYMLHDLEMLRTRGVSPEYSDNLRLISIMHGMELFLNHPVVGVGIGDVEDEMEVLYSKKTPVIPADRRFPPISQYVYWLAGLGLLGTSLLVGLLIYPLLRSGWQSYLLIGIYALTAFSFLAETTIQLQLGKTIFVLLISVVSGGIVSSEKNERND